jgi:WD40 repeat protein
LFALSANGQRVLSVAREHALLVSTVGQSGHMLLQGLSGTITALALSPDSNLAAAASLDQSIRVWDLRSGRTAHTIRTQAQARVLAFSPDGRRLAAAIDRVVTLWDVDAETPRVTLDGHAANVTSVAFSPDGSRLASGGSDLTVRLWDATTGTLLATGSGHQFDVRSVAFDPTGTRLVSASAEGARIWDTQVLEVLLTVRPGGSIAAFSADGSRLLLGENGTARILDSRSAYHPDAERMVTDLFARHHLAREVVKALREDVASDRRVREIAIEMAERRGDNPEALDTESWRIVKRADATARDYGRALAYADRATTLAPSSRSHLNTLGVARYRNGDWKAALVTLERAAAMRETPSPRDLAFLAMARFRLGQAQAARDTLERLREEMKKPDNGNNEALRGFLREAEALVTGVGAKPAAPAGAQK